MHKNLDVTESYYDEPSGKNTTMFNVFCHLKCAILCDILLISHTIFVAGNVKYFGPNQVDSNSL